MKRRDVLKGAAVAAGAAVVGLPEVAAGREEVLRDTYQGGQSSVYLTVLPDAEGKFAPHFQQLVEQWESATGGHRRPVGEVTFEPLMENGEPWLMHRDWDPTDKDKPAVLYTPMGQVFRERRWPIVDRAVGLRQHAYWKQEYGPRWDAYQAHPNGLDGGGCSPAYSHLKRFRRVARSRLYRVRVNFKAVTQDEWRRGLGPLAGEHATLELEVLTIKDLHRDKKMTTRAYYKCLGERWWRMDEIEASWPG